MFDLAREWLGKLGRRRVEMTTKFLTPLRALLALALMVSAVSTKVEAIDSNNRYFAYGVGQRTCEDYIRFREKKLETLEQKYERYTSDELYEIVNWVVEHWIAGFLTAHNLYVSDTYNVVGKLTMDDLKARLENNCRTNRKQYFTEAMITVVHELHPQRVKADSRK
jgi:hypothetical protein